jgi:hypothetical protein
MLHEHSAAQSGNPDQSPLAVKAEALLRARRARDRIFGDYIDGFGEPAWDMLLLLYVQEAHGRPRLDAATMIAETQQPAEVSSQYLLWLKSKGLTVTDGNGTMLSHRGGELMARYLEGQ